MATENIENQSNKRLRSDRNDSESDDDHSETFEEMKSKKVLKIGDTDEVEKNDEQPMPELDVADDQPKNKRSPTKLDDSDASKQIKRLKLTEEGGDPDESKNNDEQSKTESIKKINSEGSMMNKSPPNKFNDDDISLNKKKTYLVDSDNVKQTESFPGQPCSTLETYELSCPYKASSWSKYCAVLSAFEDLGISFDRDLDTSDRG